MWLQEVDAIKVFEISSTYSYTSLVQDPMIRYGKKIIKVLHLAIDLVVLCAFFTKKRH